MKLSTFQSFSRRALRHVIALGLVLGIAACGGRSDSSSSASNQVVSGDSAKVSGFPHAVNILMPASGATRAIVALHGGSGNNVSISYQLSLNSDPTLLSEATVNWDWLNANKVMMVFPQGQHIAAASGATTWSNYAMTSGQDDVAFLQALAAKIRSQYGIQDITLMGHSMGGAMTNRMWCESSATFNRYVGLAGPASAQFEDAATPCTPSTPKPYMGIIGDVDQVMQTEGHWTDAHWHINPLVVWAGNQAFLSGTMIGEWVQQGNKAAMMCGESLAQDPDTTVGNVGTWSNCGGSLLLKRVAGADHGVLTMLPQMDPSWITTSNPTTSTVVMDTVFQFVAGQ